MARGSAWRVFGSGWVEPDPLKGALAGLIGGLAGSAAMGPVIAALMRSLAPSGAAQEGGLEAGRAGARELQPTEKVAAAVSEGLLGVELTRDGLARAGDAVHFAFGAFNGALYGVAAETRREVTAGGGAGFGLALFVGANQVGLSSFRLAPPPWQTPLGVHASYAVAHLVYGVVADAVRRRVRERL